MKNKRFVVDVIAIFLVVICTFNPITPVYANSYPSPEKVFPSEKVTSLWNEIMQQEVLPDKPYNSDFRATSNRTDSYPQRKGVILVTGDKYKGVVPLDHAAIIYSKDRVVESLENGVVWGSNDWNKKYNITTAVTVNSTTIEQDEAAANWCAGQIGKPYNFSFYNITTRSEFYCSQLVWASFYDLYGIDLNTSDFDIAIHPSELIATPKTRTIYLHIKGLN